MTRRLIAPLVFGVCGVAILLALGFWQLRRLEWKEAILTDISAKMAAAPVAIPADPTEAEDEYTHVRAVGEMLPDELHVYTSAPPHGVGYRVIAPMLLEDGRRVLIDRGFVPITAKDAPRRLGPMTVEGALVWPNETDSFISPPDREKNIWFARDALLMAEALGTEPIMVVAASGDGGPDAPIPLPAGVNISNDHLGYAITWFSLAAVWAMMTGYLLWRIKRRSH